MKNLLVTLLAISLLSSCSSKVIKCDLEDGLEGTMAYAIEMVGDCANAAEVRKSVNGWVDSAGSCASSARRELEASSSICGVIVSALSASAGNAVSSAINSKFPQWQCNPQMLISGLGDVASAACLAVFPSAMMSKPKAHKAHK